jgi:hypothetical protein
MTFSKPTAPVINLNGTSAQNLIEEYKTAHTAVVDALEALRNVTINGRDFLKPQDFQMARGEQIVRLEKLQEVANDLVELAQLVQNQIDARKRI